MLVLAAGLNFWGQVLFHAIRALCMNQDLTPEALLRKSLPEGPDRSRRAVLARPINHKVSRKHRKGPRVRSCFMQFGLYA